MNKLITFCLGLLMTVVLSGCDAWEGDAVLSTGETECWSIDESLEASVEISGSAVRPEIYVDFGQDYPYMNLQMSLSWEGPSGQTGSYDFQSTVVDPSGDWLIERVSGSYPLVLTLKDEIRMEEKGTWTFRLSHNMREDEVCEVRTVGFRIDAE